MSGKSLQDPEKAQYCIASCASIFLVKVAQITCKRPRPLPTNGVLNHGAGAYYRFSMKNSSILDLGRLFVFLNFILVYSPR